MSVLWGDTGKVSVGSKKEITINSGIVTEEIVSPPAIIATSEANASIKSFTVTQDCLPSSSTGENLSNMGTIVVAGKNGSSSTSVYYRLYKNGVSTSNGSTFISSSNYYSWMHYGFTNVVVGDVLGIKIWGTANTNIDYFGMFVYPSKLSISSKSILLDLTFEVKKPAFNVPLLGTTFDRLVPFSIYSSDNSSNASITVTKDSVFPAAKLKTDLFRLGRNFIQSSVDNSTVFRYDNACVYPTKITYRELFL